MDLFQLFLYCVSTGVFFAVLATGYGMTLRASKFFNLSFGGALLMGGYMMSLFYRHLMLPLPLALLLALLLSGLYSLLSYVFIFRPLLRAKRNTLVPLIASFGLLTVTAAVFGIFFGNQVEIASRHLSDITPFMIFGASLNILQVVLIPVLLALLVALAIIRKKTRFGKAVRAVEDDAEVAELVGIPRERVLMILFFVSGVLAGLPGLAEALDYGITPASGLRFILPTFVAVVIGGMWSFRGAILGGFLLAVLQKSAVFFFGAEWEPAVPFVMLIIVLLIRPEGIFKK